MMVMTHHGKNFATLISLAITTQQQEKKSFVTSSLWLDSRVCNACRNIVNNFVIMKRRYTTWPFRTDLRYSLANFRKKQLCLFAMQISILKTWKLSIVSLAPGPRTSALQLSLIISMHLRLFVSVNQDPSPHRLHPSRKKQRKRRVHPLTPKTNS